MENTNIRNEQYALDYIIYMMVAGNFNKCSVKTHAMEQKLLLIYKEQKESCKEKLEDACAAFADKVITGNLPESIWDEDVNCKLAINPATKHPEIRFFGKGWILQICGKYITNKKIDFTYRLTYKSDAPGSAVVYKHSTYRRDAETAVEGVKANAPVHRQIGVWHVDDFLPYSA